MSLLKVRILIVIAAYVLTYVFAQFLGAFYVFLFPNTTGGSFIGAPGVIEWILGLPITLIFILTFLIHTFGGKHVWWWNIIALAPAILFEIVLDPLHIYFPIILSLIAWGLGTIANKTLRKHAPLFIAKIG